MPFDDWQFWVVTLVALGGLVLVIRPLLPKKNAAPGCGTCPTAGKSGDPTVGKKTTLTVEGRRIG